MSINVAAIPSPFIHATIKRRKNTWYTIASGNWSDPNIWMSNSMRRYSSPQTGDDVSIGLGYTVTFDTTLATTTINNFYIAGSFQVSGLTVRTINIIGDIQATGSVNLTSTNGITLNLFGVNNYINTFASGTNSTVAYARTGFQYIMNQSYRNLFLTGSGNKELTSDLVVTGNFQMNTIAPIIVFELQTYNFTVNGTSNHGNGTILRTPTNTAALLLLIGKLSSNQSATINLGSTNDMEMRGGYDWDVQTITARTLILSASQTLTSSSGSVRTLSVTADILIKSGVTITHTSSVASGGGGNISLTGNLIAESSTSIYNLTTGTFSFTSVNSFSNKMSGGTWNFTTATASLGLLFSGDVTVPYTTLNGLTITGTGTKSLSGNTTLNGNFSLTTSTLECAAFPVSIGGTSLVSGVINCTSSILFTGSTTGSGSITGNPSIESRGGFGLNNAGTGLLSYTTNNQSIPNGTWTIANQVLISGAITVTIPSGVTMIFNDIVNGNNAASTFDNRGTVNYQATQQPMLTGVLQTNLAANTFIYNGNISQNVSGGTYRTMQIGGTATPNNKTLQGNIVVATAYSVTGNAVLVLNSFTKT